MKQFWTGVAVAVAGMSLGFIVSSMTAPKPLPVSSPLPEFRAMHLAEILTVHEQTLRMGRSTGTPSMSVALHGNFRILYQPQTHYDLGQVVVFEHEGQLYSHQIVATRGREFKTKGTGNRMSDGWIRQDQIRGAVVAVIFHQ